MEYRSGVFLSRSAVSGTGMLTGYAAVFDTIAARKGDGMTWSGTEQVARTAFDANLKDDVLFTINHDPNQLLGRTGSGTVRLNVDDYGLGFELDLPDTQLGRDARTLVERGDLSGASFMAYKPTVSRIAGGVVLNGFGRLVDVTICAVGAYEGVGAVARIAGQERSLQAQLASIRAKVMLNG